MMNIYARYFHFPALHLEVDAALILFAVAIAAGSACLGAISAVRRAVRLAPAEAMRPEPPATFPAGLLERFGLRTLLSPASRMIMRNLDRRRWRAFFSALAVALSVAIVVSGRYAIDAVDRLVSVQFHTSPARGRDRGLPGAAASASPPRTGAACRRSARRAVSRGPGTPALGTPIAQIAVLGLPAGC